MKYLFSSKSAEQTKAVTEPNVLLYRIAEIIVEYCDRTGDRTINLTFDN